MPSKPFVSKILPFLWGVLVIGALCLCYCAAQASEAPTFDDKDELPLAKANFTSWPETTQVAEVTWQLLNILDTAQTISIARYPQCWGEGDTVSEALIGNHPRQEAVYALGTGYGVIHYLATRWLEQRDVRDSEGYPESSWWLAMLGWETVSLSTKIYVVDSNNTAGIRPFSHGGCRV